MSRVVPNWHKSSQRDSISARGRGRGLGPGLVEDNEPNEWDPVPRDTCTRVLSDNTIRHYALK
ncbi:hypothetical protein JYU34_000822 [Plutella xylostella]|uniref:Uncharacterized protein n=1 Tax=Plutella xylostella TaxID=51655 RepID=A0ABQ7R8W8_PLUXY|nr:hypothetical protein JYU34_000822 [Plutella xylostella]